MALKGASHWSETGIARVFLPMQEFIHRSASSGVVLFIATIAALLFANLAGLAEWYDAWLHAYVGITVGPFELKESVLHWINDGLMAIFFFLVGLEIKREILVGELSDRRAAALPFFAAMGGVIVPALLYVLFNLSGPGQSGWGIPMATDIAFALGCLALLGNRIPFTLKVFLTAVAIVDDLIAVLVIALFYSGGLNWMALGIGLAVLALLAVLNYVGVRAVLVYAGLGAIVWLAFLESGVHATIAGVLVALTVPARYRIDEPTFVARAEALLNEFRQGEYAPTPMLTNERQQHAVIELEGLCENVQAPLQKLEHSLQVWVSFLIMPIFAFANAGVPLSAGGFGGDNTSIVLGIVFGLVVGKPLGLLLTSWIVVRLNLASLPSGVTWSHMIGVGLLAGIGFTMSLFIASLAFGEGSPALEGAKLAILAASLVAGGAGLAWLIRLPSLRSRRASSPQIEGEVAPGETEQVPSG